MKLSPLVSALVFFLRFLPVTRSMPWVIAHGSLDGALLLFAKASKAITAFALAAELEASKITTDIEAAEALAERLRASKSSKLAEAERASRVAGRVNDLLS